MLDNKVDPKLLLFILSDGIDWSCARGYWGQVKEYKWEWWYKDPGELFGEINPNIALHTSLIQLRADPQMPEGPEEEWTKWHDITLDNLEEATQWALVQYNHLFNYHVNSEGIIDDIDYDGLGADVILQKIILGDVVYG